VAGIITLTTDWKNSDYYVGAVKASVLSKLPDTQFVDISHHIESYSISQAAFIVKSTYKNFPEGTIHILAVDSEPDQNGQMLLAKYNGHYFILNNNGAAELIFDSKPNETVLIETGFAFEGASFACFSIYTDIAVYILKNGDITQLGDTSLPYKKVPKLLPQLESGLINGEVIYIDNGTDDYPDGDIDVFETRKPTNPEKNEPSQIKNVTYEFRKENGVVVVKITHAGKEHIVIGEKAREAQEQINAGYGKALTAITARPTT
jgi:hypothetical protein